MSDVRDFTLENAAVIGGITNDLERREAEHRQEWQNGDIKEVDGYKVTEFNQEIFNHSVGKNVRCMAPTLGTESFSAMLTPAHKGPYQKNAQKHPPSHIPEFADRNKVREADTIDMMGDVVKGLEGKHLPYRNLIARA